MIVPIVIARSNSFSLQKGQKSLYHAATHLLVLMELLVVGERHNADVHRHFLLLSLGENFAISLIFQLGSSSVIFD